MDGGVSPRFSGATLDTIPLTLTSGPVDVLPGSQLKIRVLVRNACTGSSQPSGAARLWFNGNAVDTGSGHDGGSRFGATIAGVASDYFLRSGFVLDTTAASSRQRVGAAFGAPCESLVPFGTWSIALP